MNESGRLIEFLENDRFVCGLVIAVSENRLRLLIPNNRELLLPVSRIIHLSQEPLLAAGRLENASREELLKEIKTVAERRSLLMTSVNLQEIWELLAEDAEKAFTPSQLVRDVFGDRADDNQTAAFIRSVFADRIFFKYKNGEILVHTPAKVEQLRNDREAALRKNIFLEKGAEELVRAWQHKEPADRQLLDSCLQLVRDYYLFGREAADSGLARELLRKARLNAPQDGYHLLVRAGLWDKNENLPLLRSRIAVDFAADTLELAEKLTTPAPATLLAGARKDFRHLPVLTIDGAKTRDFDDALHVEKREGNYLVGVHISDVAHYVKPNDPLFREAEKRVSSIYFAEGLIPMLPKNLSENVFSLIAGQPRPVLSFNILLSPAGEVLDFTPQPGLIEVKRQLTYPESDQLMATDSDLAILHGLAEKLRQKRLAAGALLMPFPDLNVRIRKNDQVEVSLAEADTPGRLLISEFMILVNTLTAAFMAERELPGLFKSQPQPRQRLVHGLERDLFTLILQRKKLSPMALLTSPKPHIGIGTPHYTTISSPIRRLHDLLMQLQISNYLSGKGVLFSREELKAFSFVINSTLERINTARQARQRYWLLKYLETKAGSRQAAMVIEKGQRRILVLLTDLMMEADLPATQTVNTSPGQTVSVKIAKADALNNVLRLEW